MFAYTKFFRALALPMAVVFALANFPIVPASAEMVTTEGLVNQQLAQESRDTLDSFLARDDVQAELESLGVDPAEAQARASTLSDQEAIELAQKIDQMPAGQGALGAIIGAAVLIFIVLLITDLLGFTSVFGFTNKGSANPS